MHGDPSIRPRHKGRNLSWLFRQDFCQDLADNDVLIHLKQERVKLLSGGMLNPFRVKEGSLRLLVAASVSAGS